MGVEVQKFKAVGLLGSRFNGELVSLLGLVSGGCAQSDQRASSIATHMDASWSRGHLRRLHPYMYGPSVDVYTAGLYLRHSAPTSAWKHEI